MNHIIRYHLKLALILLIAMVITAGTASAITYNLSTGTVDKTMPDGTVVTMWGFGFTGGPITVPGPELVVPPGDTTLEINLTNNLSDSVSIIIPGQTATMTPVWINPTTGAVTSTGSRIPGDTTSRVRSLTVETAGLGGTHTYMWTNVQPGTYLYKSGTHMQVQVPMGLYGAMKKNSIAGSAYPGRPYDVDQVLLFSDIDPVIVGAVIAGKYGSACANPPCTMTSTNSYKARYFLINGEPFSYSRSAIPIGTAGQTTLLRFINAGSHEFLPVIQGLYMDVIAEDGKPYPFSKSQYSLLLAGGKSIDALITPAASGYIPLYDRSLHLTNAAGSPGGLRVYLNVPNAPQSLTVSRAGTGTGIVRATGLPGGIDCGTDCTESYNLGTVVGLTAYPDPGSIFSGWTGVDAGTETLPSATVTIGAAPVAVTATFALPAIPPSGTSLTLKRPNSGKVKKSKPYKIKWKFIAPPGPTIKIELFQNDLFVATVTDAAPAGTPNKKGKGKGLFLWTVDPTILDGTGYQIRITSTTDPTFVDLSNKTFKIVP